jgi:hypothetical protein
LPIWYWLIIIKPYSLSTLEFSFDDIRIYVVWGSKMGNYVVVINMETNFKNALVT